MTTPQKVFSFSFGSDNHSGIHPQIFEALLHANNGACSAYGDDSWSDHAVELLRHVFQAKAAEVFLVQTGTGANVLALSAFLKPYNSVLCERNSHLNVDECGAPERLLGSKLIPIDTDTKKLSPKLLRPYMRRRGDHHTSQPRIVSITNASEYGLVYTPEETRSLAEFCTDYDMVLHVDGARLANAAAALRCSLADLTTNVGVDVVSFGGTKNGALNAEAVVVLSGKPTEPLAFMRKQLAHLTSKHRFLGAQFQALLTGDLWLKNANQANECAQELAKHLVAFEEIQLVHPVESNMVFVTLPERIIKPLQEVCPFYVTDPERHVCRFVTSFATKVEDIRLFVREVGSLLI